MTEPRPGPAGAVPPAGGGGEPIADAGPTPVAMGGGLCCAPVAAGTLDAGQAQRLARAFAALADPVRLRLLNILAGAETGEACVCDLTGLVAKSQPTVSHHLRVLADAGLVSGTKRGRWVWYRAEPDQLAALSSILRPRAADPVGRAP